MKMSLQEALLDARRDTVTHRATITQKILPTSGLARVIGLQLTKTRAELNSSTRSF